jgi:DNA-binding IclR family transcriptional regulator
MSQEKRARQDTLFVNSLAKGLRLLEVFDEENQALGLSELAARSGLDKSATQRLANTLHQTGYLSKDERTRRYRPSHKFLEMAYAYMWSDPVVQLAMPKLIEFSRRIGETVNMAQLSGSDIVYVVRLPCQRTSFAATILGRRLPALVTSSGRAMVGRLPEAERDACLATWPIRPFTPATLLDREEIARSVLEGAARGYVLTTGQMILKETAVAAPIISSEGRPVAAVQCAVSARDWTPERVERELVPMLLDTANSITPSAA